MILVEGRAKSSIPRGAATGEFAFGLFDGGDMVVPGGSGADLTSAIEIVALEKSSALFFPRRSLLLFLQRHPRVALRFLESTTERLHRTMAMAARNSCLEVADRLYRKLAELSASRGIRLPNGSIRVEHGLHQSELAANIGASREAVNRQLANWRGKGLVEAGRGFVLVKSPLGLSMSVSAFVRDAAFIGSHRARE